MRYFLGLALLATPVWLLMGMALAKYGWHTLMGIIGFMFVIALMLLGAFMMEDSP